MSRISLREFQELAALSDAALVWLLLNQKLELSLDGDGLNVEVGSLSAKKLIAALSTARIDALQRSEAFLGEKLATVLSKEFEQIVDDALRIAEGDPLEIGEAK